MSTEQDALDAISIAGRRAANAERWRDEAMTLLRDAALAASQEADQKERQGHAARLQRCPQESQCRRV